MKTYAVTISYPTSDRHYRGQKAFTVEAETEQNARALALGQSPQGSSILRIAESKRQTTDEIEYVLILTGAEIRKLGAFVIAGTGYAGAEQELLTKLNSAPTRQDVNASLSWGFENDDNPPEL